MRVIPLLAVVVAIGSTTFAQRVQKPSVLRNSLRPGTAAIGGTLTDAVTKLPIVGCTVAINEIRTPVPSSAVTASDDAGAYMFSGFGDGVYHINAFCRSYRGSCYLSPETDPPSCANVTVVRDERKSNIDISLVPGAKARGRVVDSRGRPVAAATVRLGMPLDDTPVLMQTPAQTNRDGLFELSNLQAGKFRLEVELPAASDSMRPPVIYYPGVLFAAEAGAIELVAGRTLDNLTIVAPRMSDNTLTVRVVPPPQPLSKLEVSFVRVTPLTSQRVPIDADGTGTITGLVPGEYFLAARGSSDDRVWASQEVVHYFGDAQEMLLYMRPAGRITGRIVAEKGAPPVFDGMRVGATTLYDGVEINPLAFDEAPVASDGTFLLAGQSGNRKLQLLGLDLDWEIRSIEQGRNDVTASGIALTADTEAKVVIVLRRRAP